MKNYRFLFLAAGMCYFGCFFFSNGLFFTDANGTLTPVSEIDNSFWNDNLSLLLVALSALLTFVVLSMRSYSGDSLILVTVLSFLLQFGSLTWIDTGSIYTTALEANNVWLLAGLALQSVILVIVTYLIAVR